MVKRENSIAQIITAIAIVEIVGAFILGLVFGLEETYSYYRTATEINWSVTILWWIIGVVSGVFFLALSEIIEQLHQMNKKMDPTNEVDDDLELINK